MTAPLPTAIVRHSVSLYSGARIDLVSPRKETIQLADIAECLSRTDAAFADSGFYSLAQRSVILAEQVGREEGALAACYALLIESGLAVLRSVSPFWSCTGDGLPGLTRSYDQLMAAVHDAVELDWPCPASLCKPVYAMRQRLALRELMSLRQNVDQEIMQLRGAGVVPLGVHLCSMPPEKARLKWLGTWKVYAIAADLPRTPAWNGMGR